MENLHPHSANSVPRINLLEEHLIDQIKAGEVMESPANMAKELIENAIDAKATKIILQNKSNPLEYFSIKDNGHGIHSEDLPLVFARHATSKIHHYNDIYQLTSYGFRGEALASLGSIAHVRVTSTIESNPTYQVEHEHGKTRKIQKHSAQQQIPGTEIIVTELFESTPVRLKFIQQKLVELQKFRKIIMAYILAYHDMFWDWHDDQDFKRYEPEAASSRIRKILSENIEKKELTYKNIALTLWIDTKPAKKKNHLWQFIYVNKRPIQFSLIHSIIVKHLGFSPSYALFIETKQENLDVNVHPAKTEVKFFDKASVLSILTTILKSLETKIQTPEHQIGLRHSTHDPSIPHAEMSVDMNIQQGQKTQFLTCIEKNIFALYENSMVTALLKKDLLINYLFETNANDNEDDNTVPLLISKSFPFDKNHLSQNFLNSWKNLGLELQYNKKDSAWTLVSVPRHWPLLNYSYLTQIIIEQKLVSLKSLLKYLDLDRCLQPHEIPLLVDNMGRDNLVKRKILLPLKNLLEHE